MTGWAEMAPEASAWLANQVMVRGVLVLAAAWCVSWALRRWSAAGRHAVRLLALAALAVGPMLQLGRGALLPSDAPPAAMRTAAVGSQADRGASSAVADTPTRSAVARSWRAHQRGAHGVPAGLLWLWLAGATGLLLRLLADVRGAERLRRDAVPAGPKIRRVFLQVLCAVRPRRPVSVAVHPRLTVPAVVGGSRPLVLLPGDGPDWPEAQLRSAIRHEIAHVVRHDYALHVLGRIVLALYWPNPISWLTRRHLDEEREAACDERVVAWGSTPSEYARHLIDVARRARGPRLGSAAALSGRRGIAGRVTAILGGETRRRWTAGAWLAGATLFALVVLLTSGVSPFTTQREARRTRALAELRSDDAAVQKHAVWMLGELESTTDADALDALLASPTAEVRVMAAWALGEIKLGRTVSSLRPLLDDEDARVREMAVLSLGELEDPRAIDAIIGATRRDPELRRPTEWALLQIGGEELLRRTGFLSGTAGLPDPEVWSGRLSAREAVMTDQRTLTRALRDGNEEERRLAALALGRMGHEGSVDDLLEAVDDPAPSVRAAAIWALDEINPSH